MAKVGKNIENYQHVGDYDWREAVALGKAGILTVNPHPYMLTPRGHQKDISNAASQTYIKVSFDEDYVLDFWHRKIILGLEFMQGNDLDISQYSKLNDKLIAYSRKEKSREKDAELLRDAKNASDKYGQTIDYWLDTYRNAASVNAEKAANSTEKTANSSNNKAKEKVTA